MASQATQNCNSVLDDLRKIGESVLYSRRFGRIGVVAGSFGRYRVGLRLDRPDLRRYMLVLGDL